MAKEKDLKDTNSKDQLLNEALKQIEKYEKEFKNDNEKDSKGVFTQSFENKYFILCFYCTCKLYCIYFL